MRIAYWLVSAATVLGLWPPAAPAAETSEAAPRPGAEAPAERETARPRSRAGLQALYDFRDAEGAVVKDRSGVGEPLDLRIADPGAVRWADGSLEVHEDTIVRSDERAATRLSDAILHSSEITIEAWVRPGATDQSGPARIVTLSRNGSERNFTLGQDGDRFDVRLRTTETSSNGIPSLSSAAGSLTTELTHVVYTHDRTGRTRIYLDGELHREESVGGDTSNWAGSYRLGLANEHSRDRPWRGAFFLVAVYSRDLLPHEVRRHFDAGPHAQPLTPQGGDGAPPGAELFDAAVAPLLARHCLECHDSATREGGLDLSRQDTALAGGRKGNALVPGDADASLVWESVVLDEMPKDRPPLLEDEKETLRRWIEAGAHWSRPAIDAAAYTGSPRGEILVRRLTVGEYVATVRDALAVDIAREAHAKLPPDLRADGFANTAYNLTVDLGHVDAYAELAATAVEHLDVPAFVSRFVSCGSLEEDCLRDAVNGIGKWLLRGPLEARETHSFLGVTAAVAAHGGDFAEAMRYVIEAMLQSPRFLYRIEGQRGDGASWPVGDYELASRLSYALWGAPPDRELLRAADAGELYDRSAVAAQVERMIEDPRAVERSLRFVHEWLDLGRLENLRPDAQRFPAWNEALATDMREETLAYFRHVVWKKKRPLAALLNAQMTFATPRLAEHYGFEVAGEGEGRARYDLAGVPGRGGLLTQASVLTVGGDEASMVARGLFVLHDILRGAVKDPPPCVDTTPVPTEPGLSQRSIAEARIADSACGGCHSKFEPLAFGLERFDGIGAYHVVDEHGNALRDDGTLVVPGTPEPIAYQSSAELMDLLAASERVAECLTWKVAQFAVGRPLAAGDAPVVARIHAAAQRAGGTYPALMTAIVESDLVQETPTEKSQ